MKKNILELIAAFSLPVIASVAIILGTCSCSSSDVKGADGEEKESAISVGFEFGTRTVAGPVIDIFGYSVGFGVFLPSKTIEELQKVESSK